jgi:signal transduction histidine kinase
MTEVPERLLRYRRVSATLGAALVASCYGIDLVLGHPASVLAWRAAWIASLLLAAALHRPGRPAAAFWGAQLGAGATGAAVVGIVALSGGTQSIYDGMLLVSPFATLVALPDVPSAAVATGIWCILGGAGIRVGEGRSSLDVVSWILLSTVMTALAAWGAAASRRLWAAELASERDRTRMLEALGESERLRAEAERLAEVGRLASRVAHEVNNPLAVVKSNVGWLGGVDPRDPDAADRPQVTAETLESVERIARIIADLRRSARVRPAPPPQPEAEPEPKRKPG